MSDLAPATRYDAAIVFAIQFRLPWDLAPVTGTEHIVASKDELLAAVAIAAPGDAISIVGGTYDGWGDVVVPLSVKGTEDAPIVIRSHMEPVIFTGVTRLIISGECRASR